MFYHGICIVAYFVNASDKHYTIPSVFLVFLHSCRLLYSLSAALPTSIMTWGSLLASNVNNSGFIPSRGKLSTGDLQTELITVKKDT